MTDTMVFQVWEGSENVFKGVDLVGVVGSQVTILSAEFTVPAGGGLTVGAASINGRRAWAGFNCVEPGLYPVKAALELSDTQHLTIVFYIQVVPIPV